MKNQLRTCLSVVLTIVLLIGAVLAGAWRGWQGERDQVLGLLSDNGTLTNQLNERAMDAANLTVVASRHLPESDGDLAALKKCRDTLVAGKDVSAMAQADSELTKLAASLRDRLLALDTVKESQRDQVYISALTRTLASATSLKQTYADKAADFNTHMGSSLTGKIAMWLGVQPVEAQ